MLKHRHKLGITTGSQHVDGANLIQVLRSVVTRLQEESQRPRDAVVRRVFANVWWRTRHYRQLNLQPLRILYLDWKRPCTSRVRRIENIPDPVLKWGRYSHLSKYKAGPTENQRTSWVKLDPIKRVSRGAIMGYILTDPKTLSMVGHNKSHFHTLTRSRTRSPPSITS